jgi:hypothetical protein
MLYYWVFGIYTCRFWKILTVLSNVILYHHCLSTIYVPNYLVHKHTNFEKYNLYYWLEYCPIFLFSPCLLLHILYIQLKTLKYMKCIIKCNTVQYSYFSNLLLLNITCIHWNNFKYTDRTLNCNTVPYSFSFYSEIFTI